jgi:hypothetical protein
VSTASRTIAAGGGPQAVAGRVTAALAGRVWTGGGSSIRSGSHAGTLLRVGANGNIFRFGGTFKNGAIKVNFGVLGSRVTLHVRIKGLI